MKNPVKTVAKCVSDNISKMDAADLGKTIAGLLMIGGGLLVLKYGSVSTEQVTEVFDPDVAETVAEAVEAQNVVVETVETVAEAVTE